MSETEKIIRSQDEIIAILTRFAAATPAMRVAGDTQGIIEAAEQMARELEAVLAAETH